MLNVEGGVGGNETSNVQAGIGGECRVINRRDKASGANGQQFERVMIGRGVFFKSKNFNSIVIVASTRVSISDRAFKKL
jgi:hypothetical protein